MILAVDMVTRPSSLILLFFVLFLISCRERSSSYIILEGKAQGTTFRLVYQDSLGRDFSRSVDSLFRLMDASMSLWQDSSQISRINRNDTAVMVDDHFQRVFTHAQYVSFRSQGAFDATVSPLVKAWGFGTNPSQAMPDALMIDSIRQFTGYTRVRLEATRLVKDDLRIQLDFNGIAQGYTVDVIAGFLRDSGISNYLVEVGGELTAKGVNERGQSWQVGIDRPHRSNEAGRPLQTTVSLKDRSMATSGSYRKYLELNGKKRSHIINPVTGFPADHTMVSVTVVAENCMTADAWATAFMVLGPEKAIVLATEEKLELYGILIDTAGMVRILATPGFPK